MGSAILVFVSWKVCWCMVIHAKQLKLVKTRSWKVVHYMLKQSTYLRRWRCGEGGGAQATTFASPSPGSENAARQRGVHHLFLFALSSKLLSILKDFEPRFPPVMYHENERYSDWRQCEVMVSQIIFLFFRYTLFKWLFHIVKNHSSSKHDNNA